MFVLKIISFKSRTFSRSQNQFGRSCPPPHPHPPESVSIQFKTYNQMFHPPPPPSHIHAPPPPTVNVNLLQKSKTDLHVWCETYHGTDNYIKAVTLHYKHDNVHCIYVYVYTRVRLDKNMEKIHMNAPG